MMKVCYFGLIRNLVGKQEEDISLPEEANVRELIQTLIRNYGDEFKDIVLTHDGGLGPYTKILINGENIDRFDGLDTKLKEKTELSILVRVPRIVGGYI